MIGTEQIATFQPCFIQSLAHPADLFHQRQIGSCFYH
jgi:hypothetical protein